MKYTAIAINIKTPAIDPITMPAMAPELRDELELESEAKVFVSILGLEAGGLFIFAGGFTEAGATTAEAGAITGWFEGAKLGVEVGEALHTSNF